MSPTTTTTTENMELETPTTLNDDKNNGEKRLREDETDTVSKKQKTEGLEQAAAAAAEGEVKQVVDKENVGPVGLGPMTFGSSTDMFNYFYKFLHHWPINVPLNKYEYLVLLDLIKKGHPEPDKKIGSGVDAFEIRHHPKWQSRCFFVIREDSSAEDFSFRKCVDQILPLPENLKIKSDGKNASNGNNGGKKGHGGGRGGGHGRGRGRGGRR